MSHNSQRWVIVILIYADFRQNVKIHDHETAFEMTRQMKATLNSLFKDLLTTALDSEQARMYVIMNSIDYYNTERDITTAKTLLFKIDNPEKLDHNLIVDCKVIESDLGKTGNPDPKNVVQKPQLLLAILREHIQICSDEEVLFITWDHGSSFGIFREVDAKIPEIRMPIHHDLDSYPYLAHFWNLVSKKDVSKSNKLEKLKNTSQSSCLVQIGHRIYLASPSLGKESVNSGLDKHMWALDRKTKSLKIIQEKDIEAGLDIKESVVTLDSKNVREILSNEELATVFKEWLKIDCEGNVVESKRKVAVLLMMNCWMMNLHTMHSMKEIVKCLVAPQGGIDTPGYNYKAILTYLRERAHEHIKPEELAKECVTSSESLQMREKSKQLRSDGVDMIDHWKIFCVDLQRRTHTEEFALDYYTNRIFNLLLKLTPTTGNSHNLIQFYRAARLVSHDFTKSSGLEDPGFMVDIINWIKLIYDLSVHNFPKQPFPIFENLVILSEIFEFLDELFADTNENMLILAKTSGRKVYNNMAVVQFEPTGFSLFFPNSLTVNENLIDNVKKDSLLKKADSWTQFIKSIYPQEIWEPFFLNGDS